CQECGTPVEYRAEDAGRTAGCPKCGRPVELPPVVNAAAPAPAPPGVPAGIPPAADAPGAPRAAAQTVSPAVSGSGPDAARQAAAASSGAPAESAPPGETPIVGIVNRALIAFRFWESRPAAYGTYQMALARIGAWALLPVAGLFLVVAAISAARSGAAGAPETVLYGLIGFLFAVLLHYGAIRFSKTCRTEIESHPHSTPAGSVLDFLGAVCLLWIAGTWIFGVAAALRLESGWPILGTVWATAILLHLAFACLNPRSVVNTEVVREGSRPASETAISIFVFMLRAAMTLAPVVVGTGALMGAAGMVGGMIYCYRADAWNLGYFASGQLGPGNNPFTVGSFCGQITDYKLDKLAVNVISLGNFPIPDGMPGWTGFGSAVGTVIYSCLSPLVLYVTYLIGMVLAEVVQAIFAIARNSRKA
ncbi:MAG: hypothetical protein N3A38_14825, partial [Planctomycetota bacterium]|nr:hypothetical protein [Planctomycetota bacterium]